MGQRVNSARLVGAFEQGQGIIPKHERVRRPNWALPKWRRVEELVRERDGHTCQVCGWRNPYPYPHRENRMMVMDHVLPLCRGGTNDVDNLQLLCQDCNGRKGARV